MTVKDKYIELKHFEMKVTNIFLTRHHDISDADRTGWEERGSSLYIH